MPWSVLDVWCMYMLETGGQGRGLDTVCTASDLNPDLSIRSKFTMNGLEQVGLMEWLVSLNPGSFEMGAMRVI